MTFTRSLPQVAAVLALCACGGGGTGRNAAALCGGSSSCGSVTLSVAAVNARTAPAAGLTASSRPLTALTADPSGWRAGSILSDAPEEMRLFLKEITVTSDASGDTSVWQSADPGGTALVLTNGTIDLGQVLGSALQVPAGTYQQLTLRLARVAQFRGCITGAFLSSTATSRTIAASDMIAQYQPKHVGNTYTNDPITDGLAHTFCTQSSRSELAAPTFSMGHIGSNAEFQTTGASQLTEVDLERSNDAGITPDQLRAADTRVSTRLQFTVSSGQQTRLTIAVDLNRQLRYFANTREDFNPPNPGMKTGTSYFFTTIFPDSVMLMPGDPGAIQGYALDLQVGSSVVKEWLTVIRAPEGNVISGGVTPNDDNDLTVAKGGLDPTRCRETSPGLWTLGFALARDATGNAGTGSIDGFAFQAAGAQGSAVLTPLTNASAPPGPYPVLYTRKL